MCVCVRVYVREWPTIAYTNGNVNVVNLVHGIEYTYAIDIFETCDTIDDSVHFTHPMG